LYISNNKIKDWKELERLKACPELEDILLIGNPIYDGLDEKRRRLMVLKVLPGLKKIDGVMVLSSEQEEAKTI
jgi:dynein light chain 1